MRILDRYIHQSIFSIFISAVFIFTFLYILVDVTSTLDEIIDRKIPLDILIHYYLSYFPMILVNTSSFACLIATQFTYSHLNSNNEAIVMRTSGLNFWQITRPAICFSLLVSAFVFWVNEDFVPQATQTTKQIRDENMILLVDRLIKKDSKITNLTFYGLKNRLYFIDAYDPKSFELDGITIVENDPEQNVRQKIVALKGIWTGIAWKFYQCQVTTYTAEGVNTPLKVKVYKEKLMDIRETPQDFLNQRINVASMNILELKSYIARFSNSGAVKAINNLKVDLYQKFAFPLGNFVIVLIGLPFALMIKGRKGSTLVAFAIAVMIGFLYHVTCSVALAFGKGGFFPPLLAAWIPPFLFIGTAISVIESHF